MPLIPSEVLPKFKKHDLPTDANNKFKDRASIDKGLLKLKKPYLGLIDSALKISRRTKRNHPLCCAPQKLESKSNFWGVLLWLNIAMSLS